MEGCDGVLAAGSRRVREAARLKLKKVRRQAGALLIEGARLVRDALYARADVRTVFCTEQFLDSGPGRALRAACGGQVTVIAKPAAARLSDTQTPQGVFAVVGFGPVRLGELAAAARPLVLVADRIADPGNLGSMIRSAAALGASGVVVSGGSCDATNPKAVRATMGAIFRVPVVTGVDLQDAASALARRGLQVVAAVPQGGRPPWELDLARPAALLIGSEADGLPQAAAAGADQRVTLPMQGGAESLNAAAAAAALLCEAVRQRAGAVDESARRR